MKFNLTDNIRISLTEKGENLLKMKNIHYQYDNDGKIYFQIWQCITIFGKNTINRYNSNPIVSNKFFY